MSINNFFDYSTYLSAFTIRYGTDEMRSIWSEKNKRLLWRQVWVALAKAEKKAGLVSSSELADIVKHQHDIDIPRAKAIEKEIYHEVMAEIKVFSEQCTIGGGKIHLGATSTDVLDNTSIVQIHQSIAIIEKSLRELIQQFGEKIKEYENLVCMGYTHLQPAEPTTLGYRFAFYAQDLLMDLEILQKIKPLLKGKGLKGAVGTAASYAHLLEKNTITASDLEQSVLKDLEIDAVAISGQTYPRKIDLLTIELLANIASSLHKFCFDYRIMQAPNFGEWMEKRDSKRVGSSAMPFKRNPDKAEKVCGLARYIASLFNVAWTNPAHSLLERTLDDSSSQRLFLPDGFLALDECLTTTKKLLQNLEINTAAVAQNLSTYGQFAVSEPLLMELVKRGANRQEMHELIKSASMIVWEDKNLSLFDMLAKNPEVKKYISQNELAAIASPANHIGIAKQKTKEFLKKLKNK